MTDPNSWLGRFNVVLYPQAFGIRTSPRGAITQFLGTSPTAVSKHQANPSFD